MPDMVGIISADRVSTEAIPRLDDHLIEEYAALPDKAGIVARALDRLGLKTTVPSVHLPPVRPGGSAVGQAVTVRNIPEAEVPYKRWTGREPTHLGEREAYFLAERGDLVVIDGSSVYPASCLGSMSTRLAAGLGISGIVVNGCVTGVDGIKKVGLPVWARGGTTITGHQRVETIEINGPVGLMGVRIDPGDLIVADDSGITVVPFSAAEEALEVARKLASQPARLRGLIDSNATAGELKEALKSQMEAMSGK